MKVPIFQEGVPRNRGSGDKPPMSTAAGNVLIEGGPRRFFGDFLIAQKVTLLLKPRRAEQKNHLTSFPVRWF